MEEKVTFTTRRYYIPPVFSFFFLSFFLSFFFLFFSSSSSSSFSYEPGELKFFEKWRSKFRAGYILFNRWDLDVSLNIPFRNTGAWKRCWITLKITIARALSGRVNEPRCQRYFPAHVSIQLKMKLTRRSVSRDVRVTLSSGWTSLGILPFIIYWMFKQRGWWDDTQMWTNMRYKWYKSVFLSQCSLYDIFL